MLTLELTNADCYCERMTNPETLPPLVQQEYANVMNAAGYLGRGEVLLFPSGNEVALYQSETVNDNSTQFVLASTYSDIDAFKNQAAQEIGGPIDTSNQLIPEDAQSMLNSIILAASEQNRFMAIMNAPDIAGQSSFYILLVESDTTIGDKQVLTRATDGGMPFVPSFDMGSHDVYDALSRAHRQLILQ